MRLRDLDVRLELGLQESVTSAVRAGYGVTFISRSSVENDLAAGTLVEARVDGLELEREILPRARRRPRRRRAPRARSSSSRASRLAVIVRWASPSCRTRSPRSGIERPFLIASERWRDARPAARRAGWTEVPSDRRRGAGRCGRDPRGRRRLGDRHRQVRVGADRAAASSHVPTTYSGAEWTTFYGIRSPDRRIQGGGAGAHPVAIVYDVDLTLDLPRAESARARR